MNNAKRWSNVTLVPPESSIRIRRRRLWKQLLESKVMNLGNDGGGAEKLSLELSSFLGGRFPNKITILHVRGVIFKITSPNTIVATKYRSIPQMGESKIELLKH